MSQYDSYYMSHFMAPIDKIKAKLASLPLRGTAIASS